jgi:hypothetical protein
MSYFEEKRLKGTALGKPLDKLTNVRAIMPTLPKHIAKRIGGGEKS